MRTTGACTATVLGFLLAGTGVVECQTRGEYVVDGGRASDRWDRIGPGHWISHAYVAGGPYANR